MPQTEPSHLAVSVWMATGDQHAANTAIFQPIARASDAIKTVVTPLSARRVTIRTGVRCVGMLVLSR